MVGLHNKLLIVVYIIKYYILYLVRYIHGTTRVTLAADNVYHHYLVIGCIHSLRFTVEINCCYK